eukprot:1160142-Pelagomonas_calceolata.AAC.19
MAGQKPSQASKIIDGNQYQTHEFAAMLWRSRCAATPVVHVLPAPFISVPSPLLQCAVCFSITCHHLFTVLFAPVITCCFHCAICSGHPSCVINYLRCPLLSSILCCRLLTVLSIPVILCRHHSTVLSAPVLQVPMDDPLLRSHYLSETRSIVSGNTGVK